VTVGFTLQRYLARRFAIWIGSLFAATFFLIWLFDFLELVRRAGDKPGFSIGKTATMSIFRVPSLIEQALPFAVLFGSIIVYRSLSRSLELVIARSVGVSVWQFSAPPLIVTFLIGLFAVGVFNPVSAHLKQISDAIGIELLGTEQRVLLQSSGDAWLRQDGVDGESVLHAKRSLDQGSRLFGVTAFTFTRQGRFATRIEAEGAVLENGQWRLNKGQIFAPDEKPRDFATFYLSTYLTAEQIRESFAAPDTVSFWDLGNYIDLAEKSGLNAYQYRMQYQTLLARPLLLCAMVLIAAIVSLKSARFGGAIPLILGGIGAGFVLYVVTEITEDLGGAGIVPPFVAAWAPGIIAGLLGISILLYQEDG